MEVVTEQTHNMTSILLEFFSNVCFVYCTLFTQAQCCQDHIHCCPSGYSCDVAAGTCQKGNSVIPWSEKFVAKSLVQDVVCPGGKASCPDGSTCCQHSGGSYGCCPIPKVLNAICTVAIHVLIEETNKFWTSPSEPDIVK